MRIDRDRLAALSSLDDGALWGEIVKMAGGLGICLGDKAPTPEEMKKIRRALGNGKISPIDAMKIMSAYKRESGRGR